MNRQETAQLLEMRQILWTNTQPPADPIAEVDLWTALLGDFDLNTVAQAMQSKAAEDFAPTLGQLREAIMPTPTYADALNEFKVMLHSGFGMNRWRDAPWSHPLVAAFAERYFVEWCMSPDGTYDGQAAAEAAARAHFREAFRSVQARWAAGAIEARSPAQVGEGRAIEAGS